MRLATIQDEYQRDLTTLRDAMLNLGYDLSASQSRLDGIPGRAHAARLQYVTGQEVVLMPTAEDGGQDIFDRYDAYQRLDRDVREIRVEVNRAFSTFEARCRGLFARGEAPDFFGLVAQALISNDTRSLAEWSLNRLGDVGIGITWGAIKAGKGAVHIPIGLGANGKAGVLLLPAKTTSQRIFYGTNPRNWVPQKPPPAWLHKGSTFVAKHSGKLQVASGVMSVVGGLFEAHKQWTADELRPDLTQGQRQARAVATGALTATGGWAGAAAGAKIGAIAGAAGGPIGVAIGGIAGGIIGGVGGSWIGGKIADGFKWLVGG